MESKMSSSHTRLYQRAANNFEEEYVKSVEEKYCIKVPQEPEHGASMGGALERMKAWKSETNSSPTKSVTSSSPNGKISPGKSFPPNGTHFTYEKAKLKALVSQKKAALVKRQDTNDNFVKTGQKLKIRKRKMKEDGNIEHRPKRKRLTSSDRKQTYQLEGASKSEVYDAREIIVAKRAERLENEKYAIEKDLFENQEENGEKQRGREKLKVNNIQRVSTITNKFSGNVGIYDNSTNVDKSSIKIVDQNLNHITESITRENLKELYSKKIQEVSDTSPFKGKMSAFEISVLKGKQNLERRKSIESSTLRSSPRMNANVPKPDYCEKKRIKSRLSLASALDHHSGQSDNTTEQRVKKNRKRTRTVNAAGTFSLSSLENKIVRQIPKRRKSLANEKAGIGAPASGDDGKTIKYRLNGSPKLKSLPTRLSLDSISGTTDHHQGSFHKQATTNKISGTPPALYSPSFVFSDIKSPSCCNKPLQRPNTLPFDKCASPKKCDNVSDHCYLKAAETAKTKNEQLSKVRSKKSLEETVNMLRRNTSAKSKDVNLGKLSPARSDSRMSRRSSRSSTPNMSPIKSEILTPNSTPCSSPSKSPCSTPVCGASKLKKLQKKKKYLFSRNDEVLARWHDGLYYLGKILKIDERTKKCLLRYEDDSEYWSLFKDIHRVLKEEEMTCCVCLSDVSEPPNEIVLCEYCLQGYHQQCHSPNIGSGKIVDPDEPWYCRKCVFFLKASRTGKAAKDKKWDEEMKKIKLTLPYDLATLTWDQQHKNNIEATYCYCGGPGIWFQKMLQCCRCKQWYHEACMQCMEYSLLYADSFYIFVCSPCNAGKEYIKRLDVEWADLIHIGLFNLAVMQRRKYFDLNTELIPWLSENLDKLQVTKYKKLTEDEKISEVTNALECNKTRFIGGSEVRRKQSLWGLRVRVPPPRIHITLPFTGIVTDALMNKLKIKGRRSKVFMPVECKSPVNQLHHSPLHPSGSVKKRLDSASLEQGECKYSPSKQAGSPSKSARKQNKKLTFLDSLIPDDELFTSPYHPFKTELEEDVERAEQNIRTKIWNKFLETFDCSDEIESNIGINEFVSDDPPVLEKVEPVVPTNTCNGTPPMPEIQEKKPRRKSVPKLRKNNEKRSNRPSRKSSFRLSAPADLATESGKEDDFTVKHIKTVVGGNYYCCHDKKDGYGRGFAVMGRRVESDGRVEYMIKWD